MPAGAQKKKNKGKGKKNKKGNKNNKASAQATPPDPSSAALASSPPLNQDHAAPTPSSTTPQLSSDSVSATTSTPSAPDQPTASSHAMAHSTNAATAAAPTALPANFAALAINEPVKIDYNMYPHILHRIFDLVSPHDEDFDSVLLLRATCKSLQFEVDSKHFALSVVFKNGIPRTRYCNISLQDRPQLLQYSRFLDIEGPGCRCEGRCSCLATLTKTIAELAARNVVDLDKQPTFDLVRVFTSTLGLSDESHSGMRAHKTVYFVDLFPDRPHTSVMLPMAPIEGSRMVIINIRYDATNAFVPTTIFHAIRPVANAQYHVIFTPTPHPSSPAPSGGNKWQTVPFFSINETFLSAYLLRTLSLAFLDGSRGAKLFLVGCERWPLEWFKPDHLERYANLDRLERTRNVCGDMFSRLSALHRRSRASEWTEDEMEKWINEACRSLYMPSMEEYESWWFQMDPDYGLARGIGVYG